MKKYLMYYVLLAGIFSCLGILFLMKAEYTAGIILMLLVIYLLVVTLILYKQRKTRDMMDRLFNKVDKSRDEIVTLLDQS